MASSDLNSVTLVGRLTRDAELSYLPSGSAVAKMSLAVNRSRKEGDQWVSEANYFDVNLFGRQAESLKQYLTKGKQIAVQGSLRQDRWEKDGQKFSRVNIVANDVQLLGGRSDNGGSSYGAPSGGNQGYSGGYNNQGYNNQNYGGQQSYNQGAPSPEDTFGGNDEFPEDIPF